MSKFETPIEFHMQKTFGNVRVAYVDLTEITQGGPEVGTLSINERTISEYLFGGPIIYQNGFVYAPIFIRRLCVSGFKLSKIDVDTCQVELIGKIRAIIFLDRIEDGEIYFFEDLQRSAERHCTL